MRAWQGTIPSIHTTASILSDRVYAKYWQTTTLGALLLGLLMFSSASAQEAEWIWAPGVAKNQIGQVECFFRRSFNVTRAEEAELLISADDSYEVFVNGKRIGNGEGNRRMDRYDLTNVLARGRNVVAVRVENLDGNTAALAARLQVKEAQGGWKSYSTDENWKTSLKTLPLWQMPIYNDRRWKEAQSFGVLGRTEPWDRARTVAAERQHDHERFQAARDFRVERVLEDEAIGSAIALAFNEFGQLVISQEGGPLLLATPDDKGGFDVRTYCELVSSCQGLLPLNGDVYVTGQGPEGLGMYRLSDENRDGTLEKSERIMAFRGGLGEHGPHGLALGPDGMIYCVIGNFSGYDGTFGEYSPVPTSYEGDLVRPKREDPGGHAVGVKAPGGTIVRCSLDGTKVELVAAGLRNCYDLAFNADGELFTYDSDMESDIGMAWYRPTRMMHVVPGAEFGWRSGWSNWPDYYIDSLPPLVETGRGSPTGMVTYDHFMFPTKYHGAVFLGDWSEGRILAVTMKRSGATYTANTEVFLQGSPLNVTDLDVGPDGALYFVTGGRSTSGGLYRVAWNGNVPEAVKNLTDDLAGVIRQPQMQAAWARQRVAGLQGTLQETWATSIRGVALATENPAHYRTRALDLLQLYGPKPDLKLLETLVDDANEQVRAKTAELLGTNDKPEAAVSLAELLEDEDRWVRRKAAEAMLRGGHKPEFATLKRLLISDDRNEAWAGRRLLERLDPSVYHDEMLETDNHRIFIQCAVATMIAHPSRKNAYEVLARAAELMDGFVSDRNFVDLLRVVELGLERGEVPPDAIPAFAERMSDEFPSGNSIMNRELARILAYLRVTAIGDRYAEFLKGESATELDKIQVAMMLQTIRTGWDSKTRLALIEFLEKARLAEGGGSYAYYIMDAAKDLGRDASGDEVMAIVAQADRWPNAAVGAFYKLPQQLDAETLKVIREIDEKIANTDPEDDSFTQLKVGIVAVLGRSGDEASMSYLRRIWNRDEARRGTVAIGLAQQPDGENWAYLVDSLGVMDDEAAREVMKRLVTVEQRATEAERFRTVIERGYRLKDAGSGEAIALLQHWSGEHLSLEGDPWDQAMASWQRWYTKQFPTADPIALDEPSTRDGWNIDELLAMLEKDTPDEASVERGKALFASAQCAKCHRYSNVGESVGPDLTAVARRFNRRDILEAILDPSKVVSDQYRTQVVTLTDGGQASGLVTQRPDGSLVVLQSDGTKRTIAKDEVDGTEYSDVSSMPSGLIDGLSEDEVADLFAFLMQGATPAIATKPAAPVEPNRPSSTDGSSRRR